MKEVSDPAVLRGFDSFVPSNTSSDASRLLPRVLMAMWRSLARESCMNSIKTGDGMQLWLCISWFRCDYLNVRGRSSIEHAAFS